MRTRLGSHLTILLLVPWLVLASCKWGRDGSGDEHAQRKAPSSPPKPHHTPSPLPPPMSQPVPLWEGGKVTREVDAATAASFGYVLLDLGEAWVPYIFTDGVDEQGKPLPNAYRPTYLALARGDLPDNHHGERARNDKYLELYGIQPTVELMRKRFRHTVELPCTKELDLTPLIEFQSLAVHESNAAAYKVAEDYVYLRGQVQRMLHAQKVDAPEALDVAALDLRDKDRLKRYLRIAPEYQAVDAAQKRLKCEGYFKGRGRYVRGALDWTTRDALAEFERRHRVYSWGYLGKDTLAVLRVSPAEAERRAVLRVLLERAIHAAGILEDGSVSARADGQPRTYQGVDGQSYPLRNLIGELEERLVNALGLQTPESTLAFLDNLGELSKDEHRLVAFQGPYLPEYYDGDMDLTLEYDRGDVWYDFPYDDQGKPRAQPVQRRPQVTIFTRYLDQRIPLARFGTTIGGWRSELVDETVMWRYKESPVGPRVWAEIVAAPVWLPPDSTPPRELLKKKRKRKPDEPEYEVNYHETGPSYASAYGLVVAYHREYWQRPDGTIQLGRDEGIRTHGSVDYMSIMRRHSHGCHRMHNHIAVRLMSFVLAHRPHRIKGQEVLSFKKTLEYEEQTYEMDIKQGGYVFELAQPIKVQVAEGRIRGELKKPIDFVIPKFDENYGAYVTPDGGAVQLQGGQLVEIPLPPLLDAGVTELEPMPAGAISPVPPTPPVAPTPAQPYNPKAPPNPLAKPPTFFNRPNG